jgi:SAM-dependent MidA family methyltransferase
MSTSCADDVRAAISDAGGAIRFDRFMEIALYGEHGFYNAGGQAGRRGDFLTSPEVGPLFADVLARAIDEIRARLGEPDDFTVVEAGAGRGTLARALAPLVDARYVAVELSPAQRAEHPRPVESRAGFPEGPITGVVIANELLDNLPFRLAVYDAGWREAFVIDDGRGGFAEVLAAPLDPQPSWLPPHPPLGARAPIHRAAAAWVGEARALLTGGAVIAFDYCFARTAQAALSPWRDWLRTYRGHERGGHYLADAGGQDITAQVCLDQLPTADAVRTQAQFLARWGIEELVEEGRAAWRAAASRPTVEALRMRSRVREAEALTDVAGLGGFLAVDWHVHDA